MNDWPHTPDPCEWDPVNGRPAMVTDERHADATISLGNGLWHLCAKCAALREFDRFPVEQRKALPGAVPCSWRMTMRNNLTWYYSAAAPVAYRFSSGTAAVVLQPHVSAVFVPPNADLPLYEGEGRQTLARLLEAPARETRSITLGELTVWASRRVRMAVYADMNDPQRVMGCVYSREHIRDSLGWLLQERIPPAHQVSVSIVPATCLDDEEGPDVCALRMACGSWRSILAPQIPASLAGDDPLFGGEA